MVTSSHGVQKEAAEHSKDWKIGMVAFDHVLSALKEVRAQHDKDQHGQSTANSDSSSSSSSDEDDVAPATLPPKKKARLEQVADSPLGVPSPKLSAHLFPGATLCSVSRAILWIFQGSICLAQNPLPCTPFQPFSTACNSHICLI